MKINRYMVILVWTGPHGKSYRCEVIETESEQKAANAMRDKFPELNIHKIYKEVNRWH